MIFYFCGWICLLLKSLEFAAFCSTIPTNFPPDTLRCPVACDVTVNTGIHRTINGLQTMIWPALFVIVDHMMDIQHGIPHITVHASQKLRSSPPY